MTTKRKNLLAVVFSTGLFLSLGVSAFAASYQVFNYTVNSTGTFFDFKDGFFVESIYVNNCLGGASQVNIDNVGATNCDSGNSVSVFTTGENNIYTDSGTADIYFTGYYLGASSGLSIPSDFWNRLSEAVNDQLIDEGTLSIIVLIAGIPLAFYIIKKLLSLIPKK